MFNFPLTPEQASEHAYEHDVIFWVLTGLTVFFTLLVIGLVVFFAIRYRHGNKVDRSRPVFEHMKLELTWTIIPLILGLIVFFFGAKLFITMRTPDEKAMEIFVVGKQWMWHFQHPNGVRENNTLHVPLGQPVKLTMISQDVIHAMYIPEFRAQFHVVPGRYTHMWFTPSKEGIYHIFCGMYCGTQHSEMGGYVYVMKPQKYAEWLANGGATSKAVSMEQRGAELYKQLACDNCHTATDTERGPSLFGIPGKTRSFTDGGSATADDAYLRQSILNPYHNLTAGYSNTMPSYDGQLSEEDVLDLIAYIKTLGMGSPATNRSVTGEATPGGGAGTPSADGRRELAAGAIDFETPRTTGQIPGRGAAGAEGVNSATGN